MRVGIVAESFLPNVNGVTNSVLRVLEHLKREGHEAMVVAPGARDFQDEIPDYLGFEIVRVPTVMVPLVDSLPIGVPTSSTSSSRGSARPPSASSSHVTVEHRPQGYWDATRSPTPTCGVAPVPSRICGSLPELTAWGWGG